MTKTIILIPSRLAATRLPNKPLLKINGLSIINHVYQKAISSEIAETYVATGDERIYEEVTKNGGKCILTEKNHKTGLVRRTKIIQIFIYKKIRYWLDSTYLL